MLKAIIFDMDGVLINTEPFHYEIWRRTFLQRGLEIDYDHYKGCIGSTAAFLLDLIYEGYSVDFRQDATIMAEMQAMKAKLVEEEGVPRIEGVVEMLERISARGWKLAVASSSPEYYIKQAMGQIGAVDSFDLLVSGESVEHPKPAPDVFLKTAGLLGVAPEECLVVEDSTNGCKAAKAAGMACVGYYNPDSGEQNLEIADGIIGDYSKVDGDTFQKIFENATCPCKNE